MSSNQTYANAVADFQRVGSTVPGVRDLIVRGSVGLEEKPSPNWSDLDLSIVVTEIEPETRTALRALYEHLINEYDFKISLTIVTQADIEHSKHRHGAKPLSYSARLESESTSLLDRRWKTKVAFDDKGVIEDCSANLAYLIHDLRSRDLQRPQNRKDKISFLTHAAKRLKHLIRNSLIVMTGMDHPTFSSEQVSAVFADIDIDLADLIKTVKAKIGNDSLSEKEVDQYLDQLLEAADRIYHAVLTKTDKK